MKFLLLVVAVVASEQWLVQASLGPIGGSEIQFVDCPRCSDDHGLPGCRNNLNRCDLNEVCSMKYGLIGAPEFHCRKTTTCSREVANPTRNCTGGGVEISPGMCELCCHTQDCVDSLADLLQKDIASESPVLCPGKCSPYYLKGCMDTAAYCTQGQFCRVVHDNDDISGECKPEHDYGKCVGDLIKEPCGVPDEDGNLPEDCYSDCCKDNACLMKHFGSVMPTTSPAPTQPPSTTPAPATDAPTTASSSDPVCVDKIKNDGCKSFVTDLDVCHDRLAVDLCPVACGLCDLVTCKDTVANNGCATLQVTDNVCSDVLAAYICPKTCGLCGSHTQPPPPPPSTTQPPAPTTTTARPSSTASTSAQPDPSSTSQPELNTSAAPCEDNLFDGLTCAEVDGVCDNPFLSVNACPKFCGLCSSHTQPPPPPPSTTQPPPPSPSTTQPPPPPPSTTQPPPPLPSTTQPPPPPPSTTQPSPPPPSTTQPPPPPPSTTQTPAPTTTTQTAQPSSTAATSAQPDVSLTSQPELNTSAKPCVDKPVNGLACDQVESVCDNSTLALTACRKFCGLCTP